MYGGLGMSAPSLHRESTDSLIMIVIKSFVVKINFIFVHVQHNTTSDHSPAGVGCCEVVSDDVFSLSLTSAVEGREGDRGKRMERGTEREWEWVEMGRGDGGRERM